MPLWVASHPDPHDRCRWPLTRRCRSRCLSRPGRRTSPGSSWATSDSTPSTSRRRATSRSTVGLSSSTGAWPCSALWAPSGRSSTCSPGLATRRQRTCSRPWPTRHGWQSSRWWCSWASSISRARSTTSSRGACPATSGSTPSSCPRTESTRSGRSPSSSTAAWPCGRWRQSLCSSCLCRTSLPSSSPTSGRTSSTKLFLNEESNPPPLLSPFFRLCQVCGAGMVVVL